MNLTKEEIKDWIPIFQAFVDDDKEILTSLRMMYSKETIDKNDVDEEYTDGDGNEWVTKKSDWHPIDKKYGLEIIRTNRTLVNPKLFYRIREKNNEL